MTTRPRLGITTPDWCICSDTPRRGVGVELKPLGRCRQVNCVDYRWR
jgi:hypothetical protein